MANRVVAFFKTTFDVIKFSLYLSLLYIQSVFRYFIPPALKSLAGEIILITGSANGIGREICLQLTKSKATLVCWDINQRDNDLLVSELRRAGTRAYGFSVDISDRPAVEAMGLRVQREVGPVSIVINNAGILPCHPLLGHNPREIVRCFEVNLFSHFWIIRHFLPGMLERRKGHIVSISSASAMGGTQNLVPYSASKSAVHGYMESLRAEIQAHPDKPDIKITTVYPSICRTGLLQNIKSNSRFPSFLVMLKPDFVARKVVEGIQRNYNQIFIPGYLGWMTSFLTCQPVKIKMAFINFMECYLAPEEKFRNGS